MKCSLEVWGQTTFFFSTDKYFGLLLIQAHNPVDTIRKDVTELREDVKEEMATFKTDMKAAMKEEQEELKTFKTDMNAAMNELTNFKADMKTAMNELTTFKADMKAAMKEELSDAMKTLLQALTSKMEAMGSGN